MTNERVGSFVSDLVEMAKAVEQVPQLQEELRQNNKAMGDLITQLTEVQVSLEANRRYAAGLEQKVHDLEVANTAIELRFLECDDAKETLVRILDGLGKDILGALQAVTPIPAPKPEPTMAEAKIAMNEYLEPRDTFQGVKTDWPPNAPVVHTDIPLQDGSLSPFVSTPPGPDTPSSSEPKASSADASSSEGTQGSVPMDPTVTTVSEGYPNATSVPVSEPVPALGEGVSVPSDPTRMCHGSVNVTLPDAAVSSEDASNTTSIDPEPLYP